jgi:hypothetical protein
MRDFERHVQPADRANRFGNRFFDRGALVAHVGGINAALIASHAREFHDFIRFAYARHLLQAVENPIAPSAIALKTRTCMALSSGQARSRLTFPITAARTVL